MTTPPTSAASLHERLGGDQVLRTAVHAFYFNVFQDKRIAHLFAEVDSERLLKHQQDFMAYAFGGTRPYTGRALREAHQQLVREHGLNTEHFDAIVDILATTLADLSIAPALVSEVLAVVEGVREDVLGL
ncbi:MAG: group 1 truncated hemoglobin [Pseudomonadota bacterium]